MAVKYKLDQIVEETAPGQEGKKTVYIHIYDDADPDTVLARTTVQGETRAEIKAALADKIPLLKARLTATATAAQIAQQALDEFEAEEG